MAKNKDPNWKTGIRGKNYSTTLKRAHAAGAVICVMETGVPVTWDKPGRGVCIRPWVDEEGNRYDSHDLEPVF